MKWLRKLVDSIVWEKGKCYTVYGGVKDIYPARRNRLTEEVQFLRKGAYERYDPWWWPNFTAE